MGKEEYTCDILAQLENETKKLHTINFMVVDTNPVPSFWSKNFLFNNKLTLFGYSHTRLTFM